jgi:DNA polymerase-3 subunit alpha
MCSACSISASGAPQFPVPAGYDTEGYFRHVARDGLDERFRASRSKACRRNGVPRALENELDVIGRMNYPGYF